MASSVLGAVSPEGGDTREEEEKVVPRNALQMWTDDDLATLAKYIKKFPGGTVDRWERFFGSGSDGSLAFLSVLRSQKFCFCSGSRSGFYSRYR
jgi:hypothetical protein